MDRFPGFLPAFFPPFRCRSPRPSGGAEWAPHQVTGIRRGATAPLTVFPRCPYHIIGFPPPVAISAATGL
jgi:hypothetical protein